MSIEALLKELPDAAKDIRLNFTKILQADVVSLSQDEVNAIVYAVAISMEQTDLLKQVSQALEAQLDESVVYAAKVASAIMSMNNIYYRFVHLSEDKELVSMGAGLRMQGMMQHGIDKKLFELMSTAISAVNGCGMCIQSHIKALKNEGVDAEAIQFCGKVAAVVFAFNRSAH